MNDLKTILKTHQNSYQFTHCFLTYPLFNIILHYLQNKQTLFTVIRQTIKKVNLRYSLSFSRCLVILSHVLLASFADELLSHVPCKHIKNKIWRFAFGKPLVNHCRYVLATLSAITEKELLALVSLF